MEKQKTLHILQVPLGIRFAPRFRSIAAAISSRLTSQTLLSGPPRSPSKGSTRTHPCFDPLSHPFVHDAARTPCMRTAARPPIDEGGRGCPSGGSLSPAVRGAGHHPHLRSNVSTQSAPLSLVTPRIRGSYRGDFVASGCSGWQYRRPHPPFARYIFSPLSFSGTSFFAL